MIFLDIQNQFYTSQYASVYEKRIHSDINMTQKKIIFLCNWNIDCHDKSKRINAHMPSCTVPIKQNRI